MSLHVPSAYNEFDVATYKQTKSSFKQPFTIIQNNCLQVNLKHTQNVGGKSDIIRFIQSCFCQNYDQLALLDINGNIYIFDLDVSNYWYLTSIEGSSALTFCAKTCDKIVVGTVNGSVHQILVEDGSSDFFARNTHKSSVKRIIFNQSGEKFISISNEEAFLWDAKCLAKLLAISHKYVNIKLIDFLPRYNSIIACFHDDQFYIWKSKTYETIKSFSSKSWNSSHVTSSAITKDGKAMIIGSRSRSLAVIITTTWRLEKVIYLPHNDHGCNQLQFLQQPFDGGANKYLICLTLCHTIYLIDMTKAICTKLHTIHDNITSNFTLSYSGIFTAILNKSGIVNVYNNQKWINTNLPTVQSNKSIKSNKSKREISKSISQITIQKIMKGFTQFPSESRTLLWKTILQLPNNVKAYKILSSKGIHPKFQNMLNEYPFFAKAIAFSVARLASDLSHWCPLFSQIHCLPIILAPFSEVFKYDPLSAFEAVATIFINYFQYFFEDFPLAPIRIIDEMENVLYFEDQEILIHFKKFGFNANMYVWALLETIFTQVLSKDDWLIFWDSVLTNGSKFLLLTAVNYNIICRNAFLSCETKEDLEYTFYNPLNVDVKTLILKTKKLCQQIECNINFRHFKPLSKGDVYEPFLDFPKQLIEPKTSDSEIQFICDKSLSEN